jgi:Tol biopolymer transport system component
VEARSSDGKLVATSTVTIVPGPIEQVGIAPENSTLGLDMDQQYVAVGVDKFGNRIGGVKYTWSLGKGGGTIGAKGLFSAGSEPGDGDVRVKATDVQTNVTIQGTTSVTVEPDRIAFLSNRDSKEPTEAPDLYIMAADGTNVKRITKGGVDLEPPSWSPDGRRIAYTRGGQIMLTSDHDSLQTTFTNSGESPAWSPDGSKIAYQSLQEIFVSDIDGGNLTQLTFNYLLDDQPSWSPDGSKITFVHNAGRATLMGGGRRDSIYVMDSDGSNSHEITGSGKNNSFPRWSPDGKRIVFRFDSNVGIISANVNSGSAKYLNPPGGSDFGPVWSSDGDRIVLASYRDSEFPRTSAAEGRRGAAIYTMNPSGGSVVRLTNNKTWDGFAAWAPRKRGVEVSASSVVFPNASKLNELSVRELTAKVRSAVVRIETELGSGSGFVIDSQGLILTNNHVVLEAEEITVFLDNGIQHSATLLGRDQVRDLAIIRIEVSDLPTLALSGLSGVGLGTEALVVGFPLGSSDVSVTRGLVSSIKPDTGRNLQWIQTDSAINPGNSGGPLLNLQGEVIGVVSAKLTGITVEGIGFAISANTVKLYLDRLKDGEVITN